MCLIAWQWQPGEVSSFTLLANRDEYFARPTAPMARWENSDIWAGRDLQAGGTWLGVNRNGRVAALTNFRAPQLQRQDAPSRGALVKRFLESDLSAKAFVAHLQAESCQYNPFNLLLYDSIDLIGFESRIQTQRCLQMSSGFGNVSNGDFNAAWPKSIWLQQQMASQLTNGGPDEERLLDLLRNAQPAQLSELPQTGISIEREWALSSPFICLSDYGTRASTLVRITPDHLRVKERNFDGEGPTQEQAFTIPKVKA